MGVFFNGRLWMTPAVMSNVNDSAMYNKNLTVGNVLAIVGQSDGGKPNTALRLGSPQEAIKTLRSGELLDAILKAFDPSAETGSPQTIVAVRVNPATQASLMLLDSTSANAIQLQSTDYGLWNNDIKVKVEAGTNTGLKLTTQVGNDYYSQDDVARNAFSIRYTGASASAVMTVANSSIVLQAPSGTQVASIDLNTYKTVQQVVDRVNAVTGFTASVLDGNGTKTTLNGLDSYSAQDVKTATVNVTANLQAAVDWFNSTGEGFVTATRQANAGKAPVAIPFTYLSGGSNGSVTNSEWSSAYTTLQAEDVQWVVPVSSNAAIHAMNDTHCSFMTNVVRMERRGIVGTASGTSDTAALALSKALNSDRTSMVHLGFYDYNSSGSLVLFEPYILAACIAGAFSGVNPGTALTGKSLKLRGLERKLRNPTDTDLLVEGGILPVADTPTGYRVVKSITTWLTNDNYNRVEVSTGVALDFVSRNVRNILQELVGMKGNAITVSLAIARVKSTLTELARPEPQGPGVLVGDATNPPFKNITASLDGDVLRVIFECSPVIPVNYIPVSIYAVPYSGSLTV